jgi:hypothetical protein
MKKSTISNKVILSLFILFYINVLNAQNVNFIWAQGAGGSDDDWGWRIGTDIYGNCYLSGTFQDNATFGDTILTSFGWQDIFLAKYNPSGNFMWIQQAGGPGFDYCAGLAIDSANNCIITGKYAGNSTFGDTTLIDSTGFGDVFVAKYSPEIDFLWVKKFGGNDMEYTTDLAIDLFNNIYIIGAFLDTTYFDNIELISAGDWDGFFAKTGPEGDLSWVQTFGGTGFDEGFSIANDLNDNVIISGRFQGSAQIGDTILVCPNSLDFFLAKFTSEGNLIWINQLDVSSIWDIVTDHEANIFITGGFFDTVAFGDTSLTSVGSEDIFTVKYNSLGQVLWARRGGGGNLSLGDAGAGLAVDENGGIAVTGGFNDTSSFGDTVLVSKGFSDVFALKYDANGNLVWIVSAGGPSADEGHDIAYYKADQYYLSGNFCSPINFGSIGLTGYGSSDIYIAKIDTSTLTNISKPKIESPRHFLLSQNYPNPFNSVTHFSFSLTSKVQVRLEIYNILGQRVRTLVNKEMPAGEYKVQWDGRNDVGKFLGSGAYFYRIGAGDYIKTRKMILLK